MKTKKTYAVNDVLEWECCISVGKSNIRLNFSGGGISPYGQTAAEFTTSNPMLQSIIENSGYFKNNRIYILRAVNIDDAGKEKVNPANEIPKMGEDLPAESSHVPSEAEGASDGIMHIHVSDTNEAKDYLVEKFGVKASSMRSKVSINEIASEHKIVFDYEE